MTDQQPPSYPQYPSAGYTQHPMALPPSRSSARRWLPLALAVVIVLLVAGFVVVKVVRDDADAFQDAAIAFDNATNGELSGRCCFDVLEVTMGDPNHRVIVPAQRQAFTELLEQLGFGSAEVARMEQTRALDGVQTAESDIAIARWTFHPDNGLQVIFEPKR